MIGGANFSDAHTTAPRWISGRHKGQRYCLQGATPSEWLNPIVG
ncbi:hypothetical protein C4J92_2649 [Pseudomonas sp. R3-18-08]|nr:hypothetical protein C4J92_2649 [Pseudomonas sp. R3-18-08]